MKLTFYTPSYKNAEGFGGASFGFAGEEDENLTLSRSFPEEVGGDTGGFCHGQYTDYPWCAG